jgi:hypothetical protein
MIALPEDWTRRQDMSLGSRILTLIIAVAFIAIGVAVLIQRIGVVIGWDNASHAWPVVGLLILLILLIAFLVYRTVGDKMSR